MCPEAEVAASGKVKEIKTQQVSKRKIGLIKLIFYNYALIEIF